MINSKMQIRDYLKSQRGFIIWQSFFLCVVLAFFILFQLDGIVCMLLVCLFVSGNSVYLISEYMKRARYYRLLFRTLEQLPQKEYMSEMMYTPNFFEGYATEAAINILVEYINTTIEQHYQNGHFQQTYLDTWLHEIKTPLACLQVIAENESFESSRKIQFELERISYYLEQVLYFSKIETAREDYLIKATRLEQVINQSLQQNRYLLIENKVTIKKENVDFEVYSDMKWLTFIVSQIVTNAIKYKKENESAHLVFSVEQTENNVVLSIRDNGIGIPKSDMNRIFQKGYTGINGHRLGKSTGMGLYLCRILAEKLYLRLEIDSQEGEYTTVKIVLPQNMSLVQRKNDETTYE